MLYTQDKRNAAEIINRNIKRHFYITKITKAEMEPTLFWQSWGTQTKVFTEL